MSSKDFGCFLCDGKSPDQNGTCPNCSAQINIAQALPSHIDNYRVINVLGRGFYGWTVKAEDDLPQPFAIKIIPSHRISEKYIPHHEPKALVACSPHPNIARFVRHFTCRINILKKDVDVHCLVFEYIPDSRPLRAVIEHNVIQLTAAGIVEILSGIAFGLA